MIDEFIIREAAVAGQFYPMDKIELTEFINHLNNKTEVCKFKNKKIKGVIVPHAGYIFSGYTAVSAFKCLQGKEYDEIFMLGPSHYYPVQEVAVSTSKFWKTPLGRVSVSPRVKELRSKELFVENNLAHQDEHSLEVQLPFLQTYLKNNFNIIPMLTNGFKFRAVAKALSEMVDENDLFVVSSDLSHYYPYDVAVKIDKKSINEILSLNSDVVIQDDFEACGKGGIAIILEIIKAKGWKIDLIDYHNSGDFIDDRSRVVGYASFLIWEE